MKRTLEEKLESKFRRSEDLWAKRRYAFLWTSCIGPGGVRYGSYKTVYEDELATRQYVLEEIDYDVGIFYTDICHVP